MTTTQDRLDTADNAAQKAAAARHFNRGAPGRGAAERKALDVAAAQRAMHWARQSGRDAVTYG